MQEKCKKNLLIKYKIINSKLYKLPYWFITVRKGIKK